MAAASGGGSTEASRSAYATSSSVTSVLPKARSLGACRGAAPRWAASRAAAAPHPLQQQPQAEPNGTPAALPPGPGPPSSSRYSAPTGASSADASPETASRLSPACEARARRARTVCAFGSRSRWLTDAERKRCSRGGPAAAAPGGDARRWESHPAAACGQGGSFTSSSSGGTARSCEVRLSVSSSSFSQQYSSGERAGAL